MQAVEIYKKAVIDREERQERFCLDLRFFLNAETAEIEKLLPKRKVYRSGNAEEIRDYEKAMQEALAKSIMSPEEFERSKGIELMKQKGILK